MIDILDMDMMARMNPAGARNEIDKALRSGHLLARCAQRTGGLVDTSIKYDFEAVRWNAPNDVVARELCAKVKDADLIARDEEYACVMRKRREARSPLGRRVELEDGPWTCAGVASPGDWIFAVPRFGECGVATDSGLRKVLLDLLARARIAMEQ